MVGLARLSLQHWQHPVGAMDNLGLQFGLMNSLGRLAGDSPLVSILLCALVPFLLKEAFAVFAAVERTGGLVTISKSTLVITSRTIAVRNFRNHDKSNLVQLTGSCFFSSCAQAKLCRSRGLSKPSGSF